MQRMLFAAACSALLFACPPSTKPDGGGGGGGFWFGGGTGGTGGFGGSTGGGTGGSGGSGGGSSGVLADCQGFVSDYCQFLLTCGYVTDMPTCVAGLGTICPNYDVSVSKGFTRYDPAELGRCRTQITTATATCSFSGVSCNPWTGLIPDGGACEIPGDCAGNNNTCGDVTGTCQTTCVDRGGLGMPCSYGGCTSPLHCSSATGKCSAPVAPGQPCLTTEYLACGDSASCTTGVCVAYPGDGQPCTFNCQAGLFCKAEAAARVCRPRPTQGQACTGGECVAGLHCLTGVCQPLSTQGGVCATSSDCAAGLACFGTACQPLHAAGDSCTRYDQCNAANCDLALGTCTSYSEQRDAGQLCGTSAHCMAGLACRGLSAVDGGYTPGTCGVGVAGDPCARAYTSYDCAAGMRCQAADGGISGVTQGLCGVPGIRSPCSNDNDCRVEHYCMVNACEPRVALGATCAANGPPCVIGAACGAVGGGVSQCITPGKAGQPCAATSTPSAQCVSGVYCVNGTCRSSGFPGGVCSSGGGSYRCLIGACDLDGGIDGGGGTLIGNCVPPMPEGSRCVSDNECAAQRCRNGVCGALCP